MALDDPLTGLVEQAYAAALDETLWAPWSVGMTRALGASGSAFHVVEWPSGMLRHFHLGLFNPKVVEDYRDGMHLLDPQIGRLETAAGRSCTYVDTDHLDYSHAPTAEYMAWSASAGKMKHYMSSAVFLNDGSLVVGLSMHRRVADGPTPAAQRARFDKAFPEIVRAMQLGFSHGEKLQEAWWEGATAGLRDPALLLDERGCVLRMTLGAEALFAANDGLSMVGGCLCAGKPDESERLSAMIGRAVARDGAASGATRVTRRSGRAPYVLTAYPLPRRARMLAPAEAAALVTVVDRAAAPRTPTELYREAFCLSPREAEVATLLMAGHSIESSAAVLEISVATARIHLRHLLAKTGVSRQTELVRLLARLG